MKRHYRKYTRYEKELILQYRYNRVVPPFGEPQKSIAACARLINACKQSVAKIIKRLVNDVSDPDLRKTNPRRHPSLTAEVIDDLVSVPRLKEWRNLTLTARVAKIRAVYGISVSISTLRRIYVKHKVKYRMPYVNAYALAVKKASEIE